MTRNEFITTTAAEIFARLASNVTLSTWKAGELDYQNFARTSVQEAIALADALEAADTQPWPNVKHGGVPRPRPKNV